MGATIYWDLNPKAAQTVVLLDEKLKDQIRKYLRERVIRKR